MGSLGFVGDDEFQPGNKNYKLSIKLLNDCGAVNKATVPKKPRSVIKKRGREAISPPLPILKEQHLVSNGAAKKSKLIKKKERISKDEKEVAETLNALAVMFVDATKPSEPMLDDDKPSRTGSATVPEANGSNTATGDNRIPSQVINLQSAGDPQQQQKDVTFNGQSDISGVQSDLSPITRAQVSIFDSIIPSGERATAVEQVIAPSFQYGKNYYPQDDRSGIGFYQSPPSGELSSKKQGSSLRLSTNRLPAWLEKAKCATQPPVIENGVTADKDPKVVVESKSSWKRCSTHIHISRLIKVLQISDSKEELLEKCTPCGVASSNGITHSGVEKNSAEIQNAILLHKRLIIQDQQQIMPCKTSVLFSSNKQSSKFSSMGARDCDLNISRAGQSQQSQNHLMVPFSQPPSGWWSNVHGLTSAIAAPQQVQVPPYLSSKIDSNVMEPLGQHQQQGKWTSHLHDQYNRGVAILPRLLSSKYQQFAPSQHELMAMNSSLPFSNVKRTHNQIYPLHFQQDKWFFPTPTNL